MFTRCLRVFSSFHTLYFFFFFLDYRGKIVVEIKLIKILHHNHLNGWSVKLSNSSDPSPTYQICIKVWRINSLKLGGNRTSLSTKFNQWSRLFKPFPLLFDLSRLPSLTPLWNSVCKGILGEAQRYSHFNGGGVHLHERSAIPSASQTKYRPK